MPSRLTLSLLPRLSLLRPHPLARTAKRCFTATPHPQNDISPPSNPPSPTPSNPPSTTPTPTPKDLTQKLTASLSNLAPASLPEDYISDQDLQKLQSRFSPGDIYAPHDLSHAQQRSRRTRRSPRFDVCDLVGVNPVKEYKNFCMLSEYVTEMGRIKHSSETGLRPVNQRRMAKAIRRAIALGFMPATHKHPEYLMHMRERGGY
ncbi:ribosomal protein S18 [Tuber brumale]|nr:ribosomal protein S18 [Tuber brumale]